MKRKDAILTIAGFDPTGGAGILIDATVFRALGFHPLAVLTSVAAQGAAVVAEVRPLPGSFIRKELDIVFSEFQPAALKIGMVHSSDAVRTIFSFFEHRNIPAVLDPLIEASSGGDLISGPALPLLEKYLIPHCQLITPNLPEASHFLDRELRTLNQTEEAAIELSRRWDRAVLLKGGHLPGEPVDILALDGSCHKFAHSRVKPERTLRGTGCALSAAIAAGMAQGLALKEAVNGAIRFLEKTLEDSYASGLSAEVRFLDLPI